MFAIMENIMKRPVFLRKLLVVETQIYTVFKVMILHKLCSTMS